MNAWSPEVIAKHGLTPSEYAHAVEVLGREPSWPELGVLSVMWSEHCSYKSSRVHLRRLPTTGPSVAIGPGENAGAVRIGDGLLAVFKMESHNHPSYLEPYQGAATGVGGILRDVFTMGARPVAALNALRFGRLAHPRTPRLVRGVTAGIGGYGNCFGVPMVGGDTRFDPSYDGNCLVNAFVVGVAREDRLFLGTAAGVGNPILYVGARTGRDGIHGATMASAGFGEGSEEQRPTVQVGDPFQEKLLLEACLELMQRDCLVGIQDMGAAGLTSSSVEMAGRGGSGVLLELDRVPTREDGMTPYELLLSESQERMLLVVREGAEAEVKAIFDKWDLASAVVGRVTDDGLWRCTFGGEEVCRIPVGLLTDEAPKYERPIARPTDQDSRFALPATLPVVEPLADLAGLLDHPDQADTSWIWRQYDHQVGASTAVGPEGAAALVRVRVEDYGLPGAEPRALGLAVGCNGVHVALDPRVGAAGAVASCVRALACVGAAPLGTTDCLNFGNPQRPGVMWQISESIDGLAEACAALDAPVVSGNVSLYNETDGVDILPTPMIAVVGLANGPVRPVSAVWREEGLEVARLGAPAQHGVGGSAWLSMRLGRHAGAPPPVDFAAERALGAVLRGLIAEGLVEVARPVSRGGLLLALARGCFGGVGFSGAVGEGSAASLFGEDHGRAVIAVRPEAREAVERAAAEAGVPCAWLGRTGGAQIALSWPGGGLGASVAGLQAIWSGALPRRLEPRAV